MTAPPLTYTGSTFVGQKPFRAWSDMTMSERVKHLVQKFAQGNVKVVAQRIGVAQATLYRVWSGDVKNPRADMLIKLAAFFGTTADWILLGKGEYPDGPDEVLPCTRCGCTCGGAK